MSTTTRNRSLSDSVRSTNFRGSTPEHDDSGAVIQDFIEHVRGILPLLEGVKNSIAESSSRIPKASMQLSKVTEATESATVEILNVLESMTARISESQNDLEELTRLLGCFEPGDV
ncbi:MAG TPA: hypothetical protein VMM37_02520, partial [Bacteroidota bacterium]|nr:hypothetical protein [Bacteroidota bacterium]